jgi:4-hydroxy-tetrahydrodipicolinate synthase
MTNPRASVPRGSLTPLVTPFRRGEIDEPAFRASVERQIGAGSHGITVAGTTGEPAALSLKERERLFELATEVTNGRIPVLAGTGTNELGSTIRLTQSAQRLGATAVLVVTPYYVKPNQAGIYDWFARVADATDLPVVLYDIPGRAGVAIEAETIARLAANCQNVAGVKEARPDLEHVTQVLSTCGPDFAVYCGAETLCLPMLALGGAGHISATANILPQALAEMADAAFAGDWARARSLHYHLLPINQAIFLDTNPVPVKTMLAALGYIDPEVRPPLLSMPKDKADTALNVLSQYVDQPRSAADRDRRYEGVTSAIHA